MSRGDAEMLISNKTLNGILEKIERQAIEAALNAARDDDNARRDMAIKANAVRQIRRELHALSTEDNQAIPRV